jgi:hypothetical protein
MDAVMSTPFTEIKFYFPELYPIFIPKATKIVKKYSQFEFYLTRIEILTFDGKRRFDFALTKSQLFNRIPFNLEALNAFGKREPKDKKTKGLPGEEAGWNRGD